MAERLWYVLGEAQLVDGRPIVVETEMFARDAGEAWMEFSKGFIGLIWTGITVREVTHNEGEKEEGKREGADLP